MEASGSRSLGGPPPRLRAAPSIRDGAPAAHGGPADMLGCWRSSWARSAPAAVGECPPGGRRRRLLLGAALRPPCPRACSPASRAAQVHVRALLTTQCFQHCQFLLAHRLSHFEKVLGEPRFTTWATLAAHLCLVVAGVRAAGISVARQPPAKRPSAPSSTTGMLHTADPDHVCSSQV